MLRNRALSCTVVSVLLFSEACSDRTQSSSDSARALAPVFPGAPAVNTGWDPDAGPLMIAPFENSLDTVAVIVPEATDSTVSIVGSGNAPVAGLAFDLFGRSGKIASAVRSAALTSDTSKLDCSGWPLARLATKQTGWTVGFVTTRATAIPLDSIEALHSSDSASLAASIVRAAATLKSVSDPTFRGLPFRVRAAFTFRLDSIDVVVADVVRSVNEEANPRIEHLLLIGERAAGSSSPYDVRYSNRTAGSEESTQASELLAALRIGDAKHPIIIVSVEYSDGNRLGLLERIGGEWRSAWRSAYTDC